MSALVTHHEGFFVCGCLDRSGVKGQSVACFVLLMMGVRDLWKVLSRAKRKVDIRDLRGKTLAVDLSWWVCEFSSVKGKSLDCGLHA